MKTIKITENNSVISQIYFCKWLDFAKNNICPKNTVILTDKNIYGLYHEDLSSYKCIVVDAGEGSKTLSCVESIVSQMLELNCDRESFLLGVGGGVISDLTGFVASIYMRGIEFGFVSTSLLGQVDASVGGKNGVDFGGIKNILGVFSQPKFVVIDTDFMKTLPQREFVCGMAEVIKIALILDEDFVRVLQNTDISVIMSSPDIYENIVRRAVELKAEIVGKDQKEAGLRRILNFGHTFAHALEKISNDYSHGEAVGFGMQVALDIALKKQILNLQHHKLASDLLTQYHLPTRTDVPISELLEQIVYDKKRSGNSLYFVMIKRIGESEVQKLQFEELKNLLK